MSSANPLDSKYLVLVAFITCLGSLCTSTATAVSSRNSEGTACQSVCKCARIVDEDSSGSMFNEFYPLQRFTPREHQGHVVSCQRIELTSVPDSLPSSSVELYLSFNELRYLNRSSFAGLLSIRHLVLSYNKISRIENDTFYHLSHLRYVDLSNNLLQTIPDLMLCPWKPMLQAKGKMNAVQALGCPGIELHHEQVLYLALHGNRWHCTCYLQMMIQAYACLRNLGPACVKFLSVPTDKSAIGYCTTPTAIATVPINRLRAEVPELPRAQMVNLCVQRKANVDVMLLVVMLSWIAIMMGCVIHFVLYNKREMERHKCYVQGLDRSAERATAAAEKSKQIQNQRSITSDGSRRYFNPEIVINDVFVTETASLSTPSSTKNRLMKSQSPATQDSPVWKPRDAKRRRCSST